MISILITGNSLHESSSSPQQHKSVQYKWFALYLHRDVLHTDMLQTHFISCRGVSGAGGNISGSRNFCQFYLVLSKEGFQWFYCRENYTYTLKRILRRSIIFRGRGCPTFFRGGGGVQMVISIETHIRTCYFPGGVSGPHVPSGSAHGQCHHNGSIFITVPPLAIIVRH